MIFYFFCKTTNYYTLYSVYSFTINSMVKHGDRDRRKRTLFVFFILQKGFVVIVDVLLSWPKVMELKLFPLLSGSLSRSVAHLLHSIQVVQLQLFVKANENIPVRFFLNISLFCIYFLTFFYGFSDFSSPGFNFWWLWVIILVIEASWVFISWSCCSLLCSGCVSVV